MDKNLVERILLIATLVQNILPYIWTIFIAYFYIYKQTLGSELSYSVLYLATCLLRSATYCARNIKASIHNMLGLKRTIQLTGLLYLLNFFSFYKFPSLTFFYLNSLWLGLLNGILTSTVKTYIKDKQEVSSTQADFYIQIGYYISFVFWSIVSLVIFNPTNRPLVTHNADKYSDQQNNENFRTMMDVFGITAVLIIEGCTAFLEDPLKYNPAFQEWLNTKLNEEREEGEKIELNEGVPRKRIIGHLDDGSISNIHNIRMDNRISGNTLFTNKQTVEGFVINNRKSIEMRQQTTKTDKVGYEEELPISVSFLNPNKDESQHIESYGSIMQNTANGQNFYMIFVLNTLRLVTVSFIGFSTIIIGLTVYDDTFAVIAVLLFGITLKILGHAIGEQLPHLINLHKIYLLNIILNIGLSLVALNMENNFSMFMVMVGLQKLIEGVIYSIQGNLDNYLYEFEKKETAAMLFELESVVSVVIGALMALVFTNGLNFNSLFKAFVGLDVIVLALFFYMVSVRL